MSQDRGSDQVRVAVEGAVGRITLAAPDRLNAVDAAMLFAVADAVRRLDADPAVRVIALTGEGRGFCAGADLGSGTDLAGQVDSSTLDGAGDAVRALTGSATPTVALVNGVAAGVGVSLAIACDYVVASEAASFVLAFARIGLMPDGGATALVAASIGRAKAMRMALTGEKVDSDRRIAGIERDRRGARNARSPDWGQGEPLRLSQRLPGARLRSKPC